MHLKYEIGVKVILNRLNKKATLGVKNICKLLNNKTTLFLVKITDKIVGLD